MDIDYKFFIDELASSTLQLTLLTGFISPFRVA